jgi:hypothetical protein
MEETQGQTGQVNGAAQATAAQAVTQPSTSAPATSPRRTARKRTGKPNGHVATGSTPTTDSNQRTVAITLPKETLDWYTEQAAQAPFEPSVQRYIAWELRQWAAAGQQAEAQQAAAQPTEAAQ